MMGDTGRHLVKTEQTALDKLLADPSQLKDYPIETVERLFSMHKELQARERLGGRSMMRLTGCRG